MTPATIIQKAQADGVRLAMSPAGTIKATGNGAAVNRWLAVIREHKAEIIGMLKVSANDTASTPVTAEEEKAIRTWLEHIKETDPATIAEVVDKCRNDLEARRYFMKRSKEVPEPVTVNHPMTCGDCIHFERIDHPHLGHCAKGEPEAIAGLWDDDNRLCNHFSPMSK